MTTGLADMNPMERRASIAIHPWRFWLRHAGWFVLLWAASVAALAIGTVIILMLVNLVGMTV